MPFKSIAQMHMMYAEHPKIARRWMKETKNVAKLSQHVKPKKKKK